VSVAPVRGEVELADLGRHRVADLGPAVAGVYAEEAREAVEEAIAVLVPDVRALAANDDRHLVLGVVAAHAGEVEPEVTQRLFLEARSGRCRAGRSHLGPSAGCSYSTRLYV
jgi:hypothetical protein